MATFLWLYFAFLACLCSVNCVKHAQKTVSPPVQNQEQSALFSPEEMFLDIFPITAQNYTNKVMKSKDAWIIIFHDGMLLKSWKTMAMALRGIVWVGSVHRSEQESLLKKMNFDPKNNPAARVYPYGGKLVKNNHWKDVTNPNEATTVACSSLPDNTIPVDRNHLKDFFVESYKSKPSRFPTVLLETSAKLSPMFKAAVLRTEKYFNFGVIYNPTSEDFEAIGAEGVFMDVPGVLVMVQNRKDNTKDPQISTIPYNSQKLGKLDYIHLLQFLLAVNRDYRYTLVGDNMENNRSVVEMHDVLKLESKRFRIIRERKAETKKEVRGLKKDSLELPADPYLKQEL